MGLFGKLFGSKADGEDTTTPPCSDCRQRHAIAQTCSSCGAFYCHSCVTKMRALRELLSIPSLTPGRRDQTKVERDVCKCGGPMVDGLVEVRAQEGQKEGEPFEINTQQELEQVLQRLERELKAQANPSLPVTELYLDELITRFDISWSYWGPHYKFDVAAAEHWLEKELAPFGIKLGERRHNGRMQYLSWRFETASGPMKR